MIEKISRFVLVPAIIVFTAYGLIAVDLRDGHEAVPMHGRMKVAAAPEANYAVIDLGAFTNVGTPSGINDAGEVLLVKNYQGFLWRAGQITNVTPASNVSRIWGPLQNGKVYYGEGSPTNSLTALKYWASTNSQPVSVGSQYWRAWSQSAPVTPPMIDPAELNAKYNLALGTNNVSSPSTRYDAALSIASINDSETKAFAVYKRKGYTSGPEKWTFGSIASGLLGSSTEYSASSWGYSYELVTHVQNPPSAFTDYPQGGETNFVCFANSNNFAVGNQYHFSMGKWEQDLVMHADPSQARFVKTTNGAWTAVPDADYVRDVTPNAVGQGEGPYFIGKKAFSPFHGTLWCYDNGGFASELTGISPPGTEKVTGRQVSNHLVIPGGNCIWRNGRLRLLTELCPDKWGNFNISQVSPENNLLIGTAKLVKDSQGFDIPAQNQVQHSVLLVPFDIDVDSDNTTAENYPDQSKGDRGGSEETAEDSDDEDRQPGVRVYANLIDADTDGVPGYADGIDKFSNGQANSCWKFEPIIIDIGTLEKFPNSKFKFKYSASDPDQMTRQGSGVEAKYILPESGVLRIWKKDGDEVRKPQSVDQNGDFINNNQGYTAQELGWQQGNTTIRLYIEVVKAESDESFPIEVEWYPIGTGHPESMGMEKLKVRPYYISRENPGTDNEGI